MGASGNEGAAPEPPIISNEREPGTVEAKATKAPAAKTKKNGLGPQGGPMAKLANHPHSPGPQWKPMDNSCLRTELGPKTLSQPKRKPRTQGIPEVVTTIAQLATRRRAEADPPLDATKRERGTDTSSDAGSREGSSTSEEFPSSEDTTPPIVVLVVPDTGRRHNGSREAEFQKKRANTKEPQTIGATKTATQTPAEEEDGGERVDEEMVYAKDNGETVDS